MRVLSIAITSVLVLVTIIVIEPASGDGPLTGWDFIVQYDLDEPQAPEFQLMGSIPSVMSCPAGWSVTTGAGSAPDASSVARVKGSYAAGMLRFEEQNDWVVTWKTLACSGLPSLELARTGESSADASPPASWFTVANGPRLLVGWPDTNDETNYLPHKCYRWMFKGYGTDSEDIASGAVPFTGQFELMTWQSPDNTWESRRYWTTPYYIAGTYPWGIGEPEDMTPKCPVWAPAYNLADIFPVSPYYPGGLVGTLEWKWQACDFCGGLN